mmetsp:Transcript_467/g.825  ORF Transcript_467/g.825 Transcript_467/m.825 type:complete len:237 (+) Transcript_467:1133-1843(+)
MAQHSRCCLIWLRAWLSAWSLMALLSTEGSSEVFTGSVATSARILFSYSCWIPSNFLRSLIVSLDVYMSSTVTSESEKLHSSSRGRFSRNAMKMRMPKGDIAPRSCPAIDGGNLAASILTLTEMSGPFATSHVPTIPALLRHIMARFTLGKFRFPTTIQRSCSEPFLSTSQRTQFPGVQERKYCFTNSSSILSTLSPSIRLKMSLGIIFASAAGDPGCMDVQTISPPCVLDIWNPT